MTCVANVLLTHRYDLRQAMSGPVKQVVKQVTNHKNNRIQEPERSGKTLSVVLNNYCVPIFTTVFLSLLQVAEKIRRTLSLVLNHDEAHLCEFSCIVSDPGLGFRV